MFTGVFLFALGLVVCVYLFTFLIFVNLFVSINAVDCMERLVYEMTLCMSRETINSAYLLKREPIWPPVCSHRRN